VTGPGRDGLRAGSRRYRLSRVTVTVFALLFIIGIAEGAAGSIRRHPGIERHAAGTNAITVHVLLAAATAVVIVAIQSRRSRRPAAVRGPSPWAAPFSVSAVSRLRRTFQFAAGPSLPNLARVLAAVPLVLVLLYAPFRMGVQITSGLDPNATVNAWGGPTYLGALLAHWLDATVGFYAAAFLLSRLLLPPRPPGEPLGRERGQTRTRPIASDA
jgi:hypothetical protein